MINFFKIFCQFYNFIINCISPESCYFCSKILLNKNSYICNECLEDAILIDQEHCCKKCGYPIANYSNTKNFLDTNINICPSCNTEKRYFNQAYSVYQYKNIIRKTLMNLKFYFQIDSLYFIGLKMYEVYKVLPNIDIICFIPITKFKLFYKGYNHAGLIANSFYKILKKKEPDNNAILLYDFLIKTSHSKASKKMSQIDRWLKKYNFKINKKYLDSNFADNFNGKNFLIIDDIMTTGATLNVASKIIKDTFPKSKIYCLTFARTMLY